MEIPEETNHPTTVTMATDSGSNALHRSSAHADMGRQDKGQVTVAGTQEGCGLLWSLLGCEYLRVSRLAPNFQSSYLSLLGAGISGMKLYA